MSEDDDAEPFPPGSRIAGKLVVERLLGQGGMGAVYLCHHEGLRKRVAVKVLTGDLSATAIARFKSEASIAAGLESPHVVRVTDVGEDDVCGHYMVMEYLEGMDLGELLFQRGNVPVGEAAELVLQAIDALHRAHLAGVVHRDLKPQNLFLARQSDGTSIVKVLDFGVSKVTTEGAPNLTAANTVVGSPSYMSPEQLRSPQDIDARSDVWALGVVLYELVTGFQPFRGENTTALFAAVLIERPESFAAHGVETEPGFEDLVLRCLRKDRNARFATARELGLALAPFARGLSSPRLSAGLAKLPDVPTMHDAPVPTAPAAPLTPTGLPAMPRVNTSVRPMANTREEVQPRSSIPIWVVVVVSLLAGVALAAFFVLQKKEGTSTSRDAPPTSTPAREPAPPSSISEAQPSPPSASPAVSAPRAEPSATSEPTTRSVAVPPGPRPTPRSCTPPYTFQGKLKVFKPECLK